MISARKSQPDELDVGSDIGEDETNPTLGIKLLQVIGEGAYGTVYRAIWNGLLIAVKVIEHDERTQKDGNDITRAGGSFPYGGDDADLGDTIGALALPKACPLPLLLSLLT
jgi:serine/threonine protein kinase